MNSEETSFLTTSGYHKILHELYIDVIASDIEVFLDFKLKMHKKVNPFFIENIKNAQYELDSANLKTKLPIAYENLTITKQVAEIYTLPIPDNIYKTKTAIFYKWLEKKSNSIDNLPFKENELKNLKEQFEERNYGNWMQFIMDTSGNIKHDKREPKEIMAEVINQKELEIEKLLKEAGSIKDEKTILPFNLLFDYSNKENYFFSEKIESFKYIEKDLIERKYLNIEKGWIIEKTKLVAFIHFLKQFGYLRPRLKGKDEKVSLLAYRRFFENRYHINITRAMKPAEFKLGSLKKYKADFSFIIPELANL